MTKPARNHSGWAACLLIALLGSACGWSAAPHGEASLPPEAAPYFQDLLPPSELTERLDIDVLFDHACYRFRRGDAVVEIELRHPSSCAAPDGPLCVRLALRQGAGAEVLGSEARDALVHALRQARAGPPWAGLAEAPPFTGRWLLAGAAVVLALVTGMSRALRGSSHRVATAVLLCAASLAIPEVGYRMWIWRAGTLKGARGNVFVLYGVGESTMAGEPFDESFSLPRLVSARLGGHIGSRPIRIQDLAQRGAGAYAQATRFAGELVYHDRSVPGAVLIYSGHNEPYLEPDRDGAGNAPVRQWRFIDHSWLLRDLLLYVRSRQFLKPPHSMPTYEQSLRRTIEAARDAGLIPILFTLPSNISGVEPNAYARETPGIAAILESGSALEQAGDWDAAVRYYREQYNAALPASLPSALLLRYRIAHCEAALGQYAEARQDFWGVVDQDQRLNFGRATSAQNALIRHLAAEYALPLVDGVDAFERASPYGILGDELFADGHHPNLKGYWLLATACANRLAEATHGQLTHSVPTPDAMPSLGAAAVGRAHIASGSWLISTAVYHPWPVDRMALAQQHFRAAVGAGDDFSAWLGIAITEAARNGGFLRSEDNIDILGRGHVYYTNTLRIPRSYQDNLVGEFRRMGVDDTVVQRVVDLWR